MRLARQVSDLEGISASDGSRCPWSLAEDFGASSDQRSTCRSFIPLETEQCEKAWAAASCSMGEKAKLVELTALLCRRAQQHRTFPAVEQKANILMGSAEEDSGGSSPRVLEEQVIVTNSSAVLPEP